MRIVIRNEREYWENYNRAEKLRSESTDMRTEDAKRELGALSHALMQYELYARVK